MHTILTWFARLFCALAIIFFYELMEISWAYGIFVIIPLVFLAASFASIRRIFRYPPSETTDSTPGASSDHDSGTDVE